MSGDSERPPPSGADGRRMAITYAAFRELHASKWRVYAYVHTGDREAAARISEETFALLAARWPHVLRRRSADSYAWSLLKERVDRWLTDRGRGTALATAAFHGAGGGDRLPPAGDRLSPAGECARRFARLEQRIGLYAALARLPERQSDALVLTCLIGYGVRQVAELLGAEEASVRSHIGHAKRRLASVLEAQNSVRGNPCRTAMTPTVMPSKPS
ncbi:RNA polymerase sigma factor [Streptomyces eurocidicus]|uniref:RNA polymerase sigma-70 factor (ECF subfamily) n=1 Tax=Streptomyces eurocidicus TaxID=66423 RepID=A0A7W8BDP3_STREU|nr:sigma factor-like helix-turn-helix DNA-binding protein [Streptomyces eurocidicus]MBB5120908.1 RNA polymerase sigma-70 factor (ECF subfamily) [Streptomyces eurocidicus]MBF6054395.1 RNA polymerase sigma factor [Streptomyces eurocidicus]